MARKRNEPENQVEPEATEAEAAEAPEPEAASEPEAPVAPGDDVPAEEPEPEPEPEQPPASEPTEIPAAEPAEEAPVAEAEPEPEPDVEAEAAETEAPPAQPPPGPKPKRKRLPRSQRRTRTKPKRERPKARKPITRLPKPEHERGRRQERRGVVVSSAMDRTIVVEVDTIKAHPRYKKVVRRSTKFHAHDERNEAKVGDVVRIVETRPLSRTKHWRLAEIVEAAR